MISHRTGWVAILALLLGPTGLVAQTADEPFYAAPSLEQVRNRTLEWVAQQEPEDELRQKVARLWTFKDQSPSPSELHETVIHTFALVDAESGRFIEACRLDNKDPLQPPQATWLDRDEAAPFYQMNLRLFYGRYLAQRTMYDEALQILSEVDPSQVVDPASCLFYRAVCQHQLLQKKEGLDTLAKLLGQTEDVPQRFASVARLMRRELQRLREKSLDTVARKMKDSERRLDLGRGGDRVQKVQGEIVAILDELIEKAEQQQQNQGGGGGGGRQSGSNQSNSPAQESRVKGSRAPGNVENKELSQQGAWGALPPKEQHKARNLINRNFPGHYRRAVEQYFKKLATRRANGQP